MVGSDDGGSVALSASQATDSMDRDDKDLSLLSAREVKNRIIAAGGMIPAGHLEKSELVDVLKDVLASRQSLQPPSIHELSKLSVSELKRKIFFAGAHVPAGHLEKSDMVKVLHDALQAQAKRIKQAPAQTQANNKDSHKKSSSSSLPASNGQKPNSKPAKPKQEKSEAELAAEKEQEEIVKFHLLDEQELRGLVLEAGAALPAGTLSKHFLVTALRNARKAKKARAEAKASATEGGGEGEVESARSQPTARTSIDGAVELDDEVMQAQIQEMERILAGGEAGNGSFCTTPVQTSTQTVVSQDEMQEMEKRQEKEDRTASEEAPEIVDEEINKVEQLPSEGAKSPMQLDVIDVIDSGVSARRKARAGDTPIGISKVALARETKMVPVSLVEGKDSLVATKAVNVELDPDEQNGEEELPSVVSAEGKSPCKPSEEHQGGSSSKRRILPPTRSKSCPAPAQGNDDVEVGIITSEVIAEDGDEGDCCVVAPPSKSARRDTAVICI